MAADEKQPEEVRVEASSEIPKSAAAAAISKDELNDFEQRMLRLEESLREQAERTRNNLIQILAIFAALFTFVSVEFQIFRSFTSWQAGASLTLILLGSLLAFLFVLRWFTHASDEMWHAKWIFAAIGLMLIGGIWLLGESSLVSQESVPRGDRLWVEKYERIPVRFISP